MNFFLHIYKVRSPQFDIIWLEGLFSSIICSLSIKIEEIQRSETFSLIQICLKKIHDTRFDLGIFSLFFGLFYPLQYALSTKRLLNRGISDESKGRSICVPDENIITSFVEERTHKTVSTKIYYSTNIVITRNLKTSTLKNNTSR